MRNLSVGAWDPAEQIVELSDSVLAELLGAADCLDEEDFGLSMAQASRLAATVRLRPEAWQPAAALDDQQVIRLVFLKANNDFIGVLGLVDYEYNNPDHPAHAKPVRKEGFTPGNSVLLFNTTQLEERWPKIEAVEGVEVIGGPTYTEYPSYDGSSIIRVNVTRFYDADGFLVEFNQPLDPIH